MFKEAADFQAMMKELELEVRALGTGGGATAAGSASAFVVDVERDARRAAAATFLAWSKIRALRKTFEQAERMTR